MERTRNRLALLLELTAGLAEHMEVPAIAGFVLGVGLDAVEANRGTLCLVVADEPSLEVTAHVGYDVDVMDTWSRFPLDAPVPASDAVRSRLPIYLHSRDERAQRYPVFADTGGDGALAVLPLTVRDQVLGALVFGFDGERDFDPDDRSFLTALTAQCAIALDRARLYDAALRRQDALALLAETSSVLAAAGDDVEGALERITALTTPALADISSVHLLDSPLAPRLVAWMFGDGDLVPATEWVSAFGPELQAPGGLGQVLRTGREVSWDDGERFIEQIARDEAQRAVLVAMNLGGGIIVPMLARGRVLGACMFANQRPRSMSDEDRQLARTLVERAAVLLDNAFLMRQRTEISDRLQAALLPPSLPIIPGFELGARFQPAGEGLDVGGDTYDVVPLGSGGWLFVVGDVTGHGVDAAAATGLVRHTIRSAAALGMSPAGILDHVNRALLVHSGGMEVQTCCTVALVALMTTASPDRSNASDHPHVLVACGGHPRPLLRRADGSVEVLDARGRLLGFFPEVEADEITVDLLPGDSLVVFTDGVVERRGESGWFGEDDLAELVGKTDLGADALAGVIRDTVMHAFTTPLTDDMAVLVLRRDPT
jgi:serine phosphatase RsbU (regulator of sigma subunit)